MNARKFAQLDCLANLARSHKERFPGGLWKIHTIYLGLEKPLLHPTPEDWNRRIERLQQWVSTRPESITARVALAEAYVSYAWDARGDGLSDTVSKSGWKLFDQRTTKSKQILKEALVLSTKCPEWYVAMQRVALAQGWQLSARQALLDEAVKFEPAYYYYYRLHATSVLPKWGGEKGEVETFVAKSADAVGGGAGDILYFQVSSYLLCCQYDEELKLSWPRIQRGFELLEKQSGASPENWNLMARAAASFNDPAVVNKMLSRMGDQWSREIWQTSAYFESIKDWAQQLASLMNEPTAEEKAADANRHTAEGQRYQAAVDEKIHSLLQPCLQSAANETAKFEILLNIDKAGMVGQISTVGMSQVGSCLLGKMGEFRQHNQPAFTPPPRPYYWVRFDLNPGSSPSAQSR